MSTNNFFKSELPALYNFVQSSMIVYPKERVISCLRDFFSQGSYYHFSKDQWGFPNTTDHTNLAPGADLPSGYGAHPELSNTPELSTRLFIGEYYQHDGIYYPAILVKHGGVKYVPISINREQGSVQYEDIFYEDGYGNQTTIRRPKTFITAGIWEGSIIVDVMSRSLRAKDDLIEHLMIYFTEIGFKELEDVGIIVKPPTAGSPTESDDRNDKLFRQSITLDIRTEWRREIPVGNLIDTIFFTVFFKDLSMPNAPIANNLTINTEDSITDILLNL